jgi:hypothetical protein
MTPRRRPEEGKKLCGKAQRALTGFAKMPKLENYNGTGYMLIRISLIVAVLAALAAGIVNFTVVKTKIDVLTDDRNTQRDQKVQAQNELASTKTKLAATQTQLTLTQGQLADAQTQIQKVKDQLASDNTQIADLNDKLTKTTQQRDDAQGQLEAYKLTGLTAAEVLALNGKLQKTQLALDVAGQEKMVLTHRVASLQSQINEILHPDQYVTLPAGLKGVVMAVDPKWDFVVLNIGEDQGVLNHGEMLVSRDGKLVAKVIVSSVQKNRSIANLVPGWQLGDIIEGDQVIPAHPSSS